MTISQCVALALTVSVFVLDLSTPLGVVVWGLYILPLLVIVRAPRPYQPPILIGCIWLLVFAGYILSPPGIPTELGLLNRVLGLMVLSITAGVLTRQRQLHASLRQERDLSNSVLQRMLGMGFDETDSRRANEYRAHLATVVETSLDAIVGRDRNGNVTSWNKGAEEIFGYSAAEILNTPHARLVPVDHSAEMEELNTSTWRGKRVRNVQTSWQSRDGRRIDVVVTALPLRDSSGCVVGTLEIVRDISVLMEHEREIARLSHLYAALSHVNQAIVRMPTREELLQEVCRVLVEQGGFRLAWIGWSDPEQGRLVPLAKWGVENGYLQGMRGCTDGLQGGLGPSRSVLRTGKPCISNDACRDPSLAEWRADLEQNDFRALAVFPIRVKDVVCGTLSVYSARTDCFHDKEIALLGEVAADVSFGIENLEREASRRHAELQVRSEKLFSDTMIESMPGILYFYDVSGRFLRWNRNFETASGYSGEEIAKMHPLQFFSDQEKPLLESRIADVFEKGESSVEASFIAKDGTATPYFFTGRRVPFEGRMCLVGMGIDISERIKAERSLALSERNYRELVEHANSIILRWDSDGRITLLNEYGQKFFGYTAAEVIGRSVLDTIVPANESSGRDLRRLMEQICADPKAFEQNVNENVRRNGERVWIAWTNRIVRDKEGSVLEILSVGTDITEKKRAEEARRQSEARYRTLFDYAPDGIVIADPRGHYLDANPSMCRMLGYTNFELLQLHSSQIVAPSETANIEPTLDAIKAHSDHHREWHFRRKDGSEFAAEVIATRLPDNNILAMIRDISERKQAEAEREKRHRAETADRVKSAFLATMSHELRTPLNSIIGFTGIILQGLAGPLNPEQSKQLDMVRTSARHLLALVNDVLDISKIEAGQLEVARSPFDLNRSIARVIAVVDPMAQKKGLGLRTDVSLDLGEAVGDERRFEQILLNLLSNAIKFTDRGEVAVMANLVPDCILPSSPTPQPAVRIRIRDTGMGIKAEDLSKLFQPFRQIDTGLARNHEGTGLGLAICRRLTALLGGEIHVESTWQTGSTFQVTLPLKPCP